MDAVNVCYRTGGEGQCSCSEPPPALPPKPSFCETPPTTPGLIIGLTCGAMGFIVFCCAVLWMWKKGKFSALRLTRNNAGKECLTEQPHSGGDNVQLRKFVKDGTVIIDPSLPNDSPNPLINSAPTETPPKPIAAGLPPVLSVEQTKETSTSQPSTPNSTTQEKKKKKKTFNNKISPENTALPPIKGAPQTEQPSEENG